MLYDIVKTAKRDLLREGAKPKLRVKGRQN
jgi:hypothetical protein